MQQLRYVNISSTKLGELCHKLVFTFTAAVDRYLEWKDHYSVELGHPFSTMVCDLCAKLHDKRSVELPRVNR